MLRTIGVSLLAWLSMSAASYAEVLPIVCAGTLDSYSSAGEHVHGSINAGGFVDLEHQYVKTPVGDFQITRVTTDVYRFDSSVPETLADGRKVNRSGSLDRLNGKMAIV